MDEEPSAEPFSFPAGQRDEEKLWVHEIPAYGFVEAEIDIRRSMARTASNSRFFSDFKNLSRPIVVCVDELFDEFMQNFIGVVDIRDYPLPLLEFNRHHFSLTASAERIVEDLTRLKHKGARSTLSIERNTT